MNRWAVLAALVALNIGSARGNDNPVDASKMLTACEAMIQSATLRDGRTIVRGTFEDGLCNGMVLGTMALSSSCEPSNADASQMIRVFLNYGKRHPEQLNWSAPIVMAMSFAEAFPCPAPKK